MYEDKEEAVRILVVKTLALVVALCSEINRYGQYLDFALKLIDDESVSIFDATCKLLLPALAEWGLSNGELISI